MSNITKRAISGAVYVTLMVGGLLLGRIYFAVVCATLMVLGILEFAKITGRDLKSVGFRLVTVVDIIAGILLLCVGLAIESDPKILVMLLAGFIVMLMIRLITELYAKNDNPLKELSMSLFMLVYIGIGLASMLAMAYMPVAVLLTLVVIWSNDTGAYLVGCALGRHRMFERISPKKSWEGFVGGLVIACGVAVLFALLFLTTGEFGVEEWIRLLGLAIVVVVFGTWGDLVESLIKRSLHIKDSGHIIPGHGGILDRIDSLLLAMPAALIYCFCTDTFRLFV